MATEKETVFPKAITVEIPPKTVIEADGDATSTPPKTGLVRQTSGIKTNCLCAPTMHAGSFRCRLHRGPSLQRTKSIDSVNLPDSPDKAPDANSK
ncbi:hypothetical protein Syun_020419 [Stephania yunnanensis]|uniref:Uncharacterized protein n=1 Tax=Stephania yunnanensis TaxID=152371 RepID=A0AAP0IE73_9MAGN